MIFDYFKTVKTIDHETLRNRFPDDLLRNNAVVRLGKSDFESLLQHGESLTVTVLDSVPSEPIPEGAVTIYEASADTSMEEFEQMFRSFTPEHENPLMGIYTSDRPGIRCAVLTLSPAN